MHEFLLVTNVMIINGKYGDAMGLPQLSNASIHSTYYINMKFPLSWKISTFFSGVIFFKLFKVNEIILVFII